MGIRPLAAEEQEAESAPVARERPSPGLIPASRKAKPRRVGLTPRRRQSQRERERERERRVSDADASYNASPVSTRTLEHVIPQRNHANYNSLSVATRSLSQGPCLRFVVDQQRPTQNPTLCLACTPNGVSAPNKDARQKPPYPTPGSLSSPCSL